MTRRSCYYEPVRLPKLRMRRSGRQRGRPGAWAGASVIAVTAAAGARDWVYRAAAGLLIALGILTGFTGARTPVIWFKICPFLLGGSAALLLAASVI